jgi:hypothetical protein
MNKEANIKLQVIFLHYILPLILTAIFFLFIRPFNPDDIILVAGFTAVMIWNSLRKRRSYVFKILLDDGQLFLWYYTPLLRTKHVILPLNKILDSEIVRHNWVMHYPKGVNIKYENIWIGYYLLNRKLIEQINEVLAAHHICMPRAKTSGYKY